MAQLTNWLANNQPSWAAYRALMTCRLVALDKQPGTRPVGIGEIYHRLMAKCVISACGHQATAACGNENLCAGLPAGIEGAIHAMHEVWTGITNPTESPPPNNNQFHCGNDEAESPTKETEEKEEMEEMEEQHPTTDSVTEKEISAVLLVDARNGFQ